MRAPDGLAPAAAELLRDVVVVQDLAQARRIVRDRPELKAVTRAGDLLGSRWARGGSARPQSLLELRVAADEAAAGLAGAQRRCEQAAEQLAEAVQAEEAARQSVTQTLARRQEADAAAAAVSGRLGRLAGAARAARDEADRLDATIEAARLAGEQGLAKLARLRQDLAAAEEAADEPAEPDEEVNGSGWLREDLAERCATARDAEMEARLEVRTAEERLRAISGRADSLTAAAAAERQARERAAQRRARRAEQAAVAHAVALGARYAVEAAERSVAEAAERRTEAQGASAGGAGELKAVRARVRDLAADLDTVVNTAHGTEIARAEHRLRLAQLSDHALEEFGIETDALVAEYGPEVPVPVPGAAC